MFDGDWNACAENGARRVAARRWSGDRSDLVAIFETPTLEPFAEHHAALPIGVIW